MPHECFLLSSFRFEIHIYTMRDNVSINYCVNIHSYILTLSLSRSAFVRVACYTHVITTMYHASTAVLLYLNAAETELGTCVYIIVIIRPHCKTAVGNNRELKNIGQYYIVAIRREQFLKTNDSLGSQ